MHWCAAIVMRMWEGRQTPHLILLLSDREGGLRLDLPQLWRADATNMERNRGEHSGGGEGGGEGHLEVHDRAADAGQRPQRHRQAAHQLAAVPAALPVLQRRLEGVVAVRRRRLRQLRGEGVGALHAAAGAGAQVPAAGVVQGASHGAEAAAPAGGGEGSAAVADPPVAQPLRRRAPFQTSAAAAGRCHKAPPVPAEI